MSRVWEGGGGGEEVNKGVANVMEGLSRASDWGGVAWDFAASCSSLLLMPTKAMAASAH